MVVVVMVIMRLMARWEVMNFDMHLRNKVPVEKIQRTFIRVVAHVIHITLKRPIDSFGTKNRVSVFF